jgi:hypothetical protein
VTLLDCLRHRLGRIHWVRGIWKYREANRLCNQRGLLLGTRLCRRHKAALYLVLFVNAAYWAAFGNWIDGWDASLWLLAFLLLDLDLFRQSNEPDGLERR